jgi:cytochrome c-type biogenesis protein CcmF
VKNADNSNYAAAVGIMTVYRNGTLVDTLLPERRFYRSSEQPTTEVALRSGLKEDLYVVLAGFNPDNNKAIIHAYLNPLVSWIWMGGLVFMLGTMICLMPDKHERALHKAALPSEVEELAKV